MIFFSSNQDVYMRCSACNQVSRVQMLVIGEEVKAKHVMAICDVCREEIAKQAAQPLNIPANPGGQLVRVQFGKEDKQKKR